MKTNPIKIMKKVLAVFGTVSLLGFFLAGCSNLFEPDRDIPNSQKDGGLVGIYIGGETPRTLQPSWDALAGYQLTFSGGHVPVSITEGNYAEVYLADGTYTITAAAYRAGGVIGNAGDEAARGSVSVTLAGGIITSNGGRVPPIILEAIGEGLGTFHYEIAKGNSVSGYLKLWQTDGTGPVSGFGTDGELPIDSAEVTGDYTLEKGRYIAEIRLTNSAGKVAFYREVIELWPGASTALVYEPEIYLDPSAILPNSEAVLAASTVIGGNAIGAKISGTGDSESDPVRYKLAVQNIANVSAEFVTEGDSLFANLFWIANNGSAPGGTGYNPAPIGVTNFSANNTLWIKVVSEDGSTTMYYKFELFPPPPTKGAFTDTNTAVNTLSGTITWTPPSLPSGIKGYHVYYGSDENTILAGWESTPRYEIDDAFTGSQTVSALSPPAGTNYFLIYSYKTGGEDYPVCLAIPIVDIIFSANYGAFTVRSTNPSASAVSYSDSVLTISQSGIYFITGTGSAATDRIRISSSAPLEVDIILKNVHIDVSGTSGACALETNYNNNSVKTVNLTIEGTNTLISGENQAGINVPSQTSLVITKSSTGTLTATGGGNGAGIGGGGSSSSWGQGSDGGAITITGGTVTATSSRNGAGIGGGGSSGEGSYGGSGGTISITGGTVTATGSSNSAGIGGGSSSGSGGYGGSGGTISITSGTVTATGSSNSAGIGGGGGYSGGNGGTISITGGTVTATGGDGAGIGGGRGSLWGGGSGGIISITGGTVTATSGYSYGAGIGGGGGVYGSGGDGSYGKGNGGSGGTISITGGTVTATSGSGAGIGGGGGYYDSSSGGGIGGSGGTISITGGTVTATGSSGAGIGGGGSYSGNSSSSGGSGGTISITGGMITTTSSSGAGIGGGGHRYNGSDGSAGTITSFSGGAVIIASSIQPTLIEGGNANNAIAFNGTTGTMYGNVTLGTDTTIPVGRLLPVVPGKTLIIPMEITLTNNGTIFVDNGGLIIGSVTGNQPGYPALTISGSAPYTYANGVLTITDSGTAAIGMKNGVTLTNVDRLVISSGKNVDITLSGVNIEVSSLSDICAFDMTGATVNLTLTGNNALKSGSNKAGLQVPAGATLIITGNSTGILEAAGGQYGAGIGGGNGDNGGTITIAGGTVTATGGGAGAGIGGGYNGNGGTISINGGMITTGRYGGTGIGGGYNGSPGTITSLSGNAIVFASSIQPAITDGVNATSGIVFNSTNGIMYGDVILFQDLTITSDKKLLIRSTNALTIPAGITLQNNGVIYVFNDSIINGTITENQPVFSDLKVSGSNSLDYSPGVLTINGSGTYTIGMKNSITSTTERIVVNSGVSANITFSGITIDVSGTAGTCAFDMTGATVNLTITGNNALKSGLYEAGLRVPNGATLTITGSSTGTLTATGGYNGAGIGGRYEESGGTFSINGGTVTAIGNNGFGIGGGSWGSAGTITSLSGNAIVFTSSIQPAITDGVNATEAIVFNGDTGTQYGNVTLRTNVTFPVNKTLTIPSDHTLTIPEAITLTNNGTINNQGTIDQYGVIDGSGSVTGNPVAVH
ncbi:beta strand repeat-containing protein [Leadbettera azotonutricia]|uniref:Putative outer membrane autotransporter n=1 Tax=Leadbettera azotonutricia (strain ATCC BAA-888 / DSM 13862 / ZAS-9) TaxID=545695 RepID=F5YED6_LEAAZ|nr:putative outer membrane autotransporter [Leadbettera azotonutricia]AEF82533.1 putative outer membrane autotransporter [Leadbettera azotonutricia ZAS-9]